MVLGSFIAQRVVLSLGLAFALGVEGNPCAADLSLSGTSAGFEDGNIASLSVSYGGVDDGYDDSWMGRGYNVVVFAEDTLTYVNSATFDIFTGPSESTAMLSFLQGLPDGVVVAILSTDAIEHWALTYTGADLKTFISTDFGGTDFASGNFRDSYALVSIKGSGAPLFEGTTTAGTGAVILTNVLVQCSGTASPTIATVPVPMPTKAPTGACAGDLSLSGTSAGFEDGNIASLSVSYGGVDSSYDDSWMGRGYNIVVFAEDALTYVNSATFDIFTGGPTESTAMLSFLLGLPNGVVVAILSTDAVEHWALTYTGADLKNYMSAVFGGTDFASGNFRDSYALVSVKGSGVSLFEGTTTAGTGAVTLSNVFVQCPGTVPVMSPTAVPMPMPTNVPTGACASDLSLSGTSAGFEDGNIASLSVSYGGVDRGFDDSWMGRGYNVVVFAEDTLEYAVSATFDILDGTAESTAMLSFLLGLPNGVVVVILAMDAVEHWKLTYTGADLKNYMSAVFGGTDFASGNFRDSYALVSVKGSGAPLFEGTTTAGTGAVTLSNVLVQCPTAPVMSPTAVPMPMPTKAPTGACAGDLSLSGTSAGFEDGQIASLSVSYGGVDSGFDDSWMGRGYNVVVFDADTVKYAVSATFDILDGTAESTAMLSFLQGLPNGAVVVILAMDAVEHWALTYTGTDLKNYMGAVFGGTDFASGDFRDSYALVSVKGSGAPLFEGTTAAGTGAVTLSNVLVQCSGTAGPTTSPSLSPTVSPAPTTGDTVAVIVGLKFTAFREGDVTCAIVTKTQAIKSLAAKVRSCSATFTLDPVGRRLSTAKVAVLSSSLSSAEMELGDGSRHRRRLSGTASVNIILAASLSEAGLSTADALEESIKTKVQDSIDDGTINDDVETGCGCDVEALTVATDTNREYPSLRPTPVPTLMPTTTPAPTPKPTPIPSATPTPLPSAAPSQIPTPVPSAAPTPLPSAAPSQLPSPIPTTPTQIPTPLPSATPTPNPSAVPSQIPTPAPGRKPTPSPTPVPSAAPTLPPSEVPSQIPTPVPSTAPTPLPSTVPLASPTLSPTPAPTPQPTPTPPPSPAPTPLPTLVPTSSPTPYCLAGTYHSGDRNTFTFPSNDTAVHDECHDCVPGQYQDQGGEGSCKDCLAGQMQGAYGKPACNDCQPGTYCPSAGLTSGVDCANGTFANAAGATSCKDCASGRYASGLGSSGCTICGSGRYAEGGSVGCTECPAGKYSASVVGVGACETCASGWNQQSSGQESCTVCPTGKYCPAAAAPSYPCNPGKYSTGGASSCTSCSAGRYQSNAVASSCVVCAAGKYQPTSGQPSCQPCPEGYSCGDGNGASLCVMGTYSATGATECIDCTPGQFNIYDGSTECDHCAKGRYQDEEGQSACKGCPAGEYTNDFGRTDCDECPAKYYQAQTHSTGCVPCPGGTYCSSTGMATPLPCSACYWAPLLSTSCTRCPTEECCPAGKCFSQSTCSSPTEPPTFAPTPYPSEVPSPAPTPAPTLAPTPAPTPAPTLEPTPVPTDTPTPVPTSTPTLVPTPVPTDTPTPVPTFTPTLAPTPVPTDTPTPLPTSTPTPAPTPVPTDTPTSVPTFTPTPAPTPVPTDTPTPLPTPAPSPVPTTPDPTSVPTLKPSPQPTQVACLPGSYRDTENLSDCQPCPSGQYQSTYNKPSCEDCAGGQYQDQAGKSACKECQGGRYESSTGATSGCSACSAGRYQAQEGETACEACPSGRYCPVSEMDQMGTTCAAGTYSAPAASGCTSCAAGYYSDGVGSGSCDSCPAGKTTSGTGSTSEVSCVSGP